MEFSRGTHWKETIFYLKKDVNVNRHNFLKGSIAVRKSHVNFREFDVKISYHFVSKDKNEEKENWYQLYKIR